MFRLLRFVCFAMVAFAVLAPARAELVYDLAFRFSGDTAPIANGANFVVSSNQQFVGVELLLVERVFGTTQSIFGNDALVSGNRFGNLLGFQANLGAIGADGQFANAQVNTTGGAANPNNDADTVAYLDLGSAIFNQPGLGSTLIEPGVRAALLGTVDLTAPTLGQTTFTLSDFSTANGDFGTFGVGGLENAAAASGGSFNNGSFSVTAVPEPSSFLALACLGVGGAWYRRRRASNQQA
jgi:hypothetical protein